MVKKDAFFGVYMTLEMVGEEWIVRQLRKFWTVDDNGVDW